MQQALVAYTRMRCAETELENHQFFQVQRKMKTGNRGTEETNVQTDNEWCSGKI